MLLKYEEYSFNENIKIIAEELLKISENSINEGKIGDLLFKGKNILDFIETKSGWAKRLLDDPSKLFNKTGVMSKSDFNKFVEAYAKIYDDIDTDFLKQHKKSFDTINSLLKTYIKKQRLQTEIATRSQKIAQAEEEERLIDADAKKKKSAARKRKEDLIKGSKKKKKTRRKR